MKKICTLIILFLCLCVLAGCECRHDWIDATCTAPKTCSKCGITEGETLWHNWKEATCTDPKTCAQCGLTEGSKLGHDWELATCETPSTCKACGIVEGQPLGHFPEDWELISLDLDKLLKVYEQRCSLCKQQIDRRSEILTSLVEKDLFLLTPNELMQRFASIAKANGLVLNYSFTNTGVGAGGLVEWEDSGIIVQFMKQDQSMVTMSDLELPVACCASLSTVGQVDAKIPLYFMITCDPSLDLDSAAQLYQELQEKYEEVSKTEVIMHHTHNKMLYEYMSLSLGDIGITESMAMLNIYAGTFAE